MSDKNNTCQIGSQDYFQDTCQEYFNDSFETDSQDFGHSSRYDSTEIHKRLSFDSESIKTRYLKLHHNQLIFDVPAYLYNVGAVVIGIPLVITKNNHYACRVNPSFVDGGDISDYVQVVVGDPANPSQHKVYITADGKYLYINIPFIASKLIKQKMIITFTTFHLPLCFEDLSNTISDDRDPYGHIIYRYRIAGQLVSISDSVVITKQQQLLSLKFFTSPSQVSSPSLLPSASLTPSTTSSIAASPSASLTPSSSATPSSSILVTPTPTPSSSILVTPTPTPSSSILVTPTPTPSSSMLVTPTPTPSSSILVSPTPSSSLFGG